MLFDEFEYDTSGNDTSVADAEAAKFLRQQETTTDGNVVPLVSDERDVGGASVLQKLGSIDISSTARNMGAIVGNVQYQAGQAVANFRGARNAAASDNKLMLWWQYASTTDKIMAGLAVAGILVVLLKK